MTYPEILAKVLEYVKSTGEVLSTEAFKLAVKKAYYYGISDAIVTLLIVLFLLAILYYVNWMRNKELAIRKEQKEHYTLSFDTELNYILWKIGVIFCILVVTVWGTCCATNWLINPEIGAITIIINLARTMFGG
jgi:H+/gluconate symporter-like permease